MLNDHPISIISLDIGGTKTADVLLAVPSSSTARTQEIHLLLIHAWCAYIDDVLG